MSAFDKVIGYEDIKMELERYCDALKNPEKYRKLGVNIPSGVLIYGRPGLGKTLLANCFIEESGRKTFTIRKDQPDGEFVDVIRKTFEKAKQEAPSIVFLDDLDKFANEDEDHRDAEEYVTVQSCIDACRHDEVFVLVTANDIQNLPESLTRAGRMDTRIELELPADEDTLKIIKHYLEQKETVGDIDAEELAGIMEGSSCAELETFINEAGIDAAYEGKDKIGQADLIQAFLRKELYATGKIDNVDHKILEQIAVHEAGHALISEIFRPGSVKLITINTYSGTHGGATLIRRPPIFYYSYDLQEQDIVRRLGGKAATEIVLGVEDMGAYGDIERACSKLNHLIAHTGAYGFNNVEVIRHNDIDEADRSQQVRKELNRYYMQAKRIIIENRAYYDAIVKELLKKKTLTAKDLVILREQAA